MWFSMWTLLAVASFGVAWFLMIYYLIKRRNAHFSRQQKLEELILDKINSANHKKPKKDSSKQKKQLLPRNSLGLTLLTILIVPAFYVFYFLKNDLQKHEEQEHDFLSKVITLTKDSEVPLNIQPLITSPRISKKKYFVLSVATCGLAAVYWLYRIFNDYNSHFKMQWLIEDELLSFLKATEKKES
jgi:preprotein translocase subunit YajC